MTTQNCRTWTDKKPESIFRTAVFDLKSRNLIGNAAAGLERPDRNWNRRCLTDCAAMKWKCRVWSENCRNSSAKPVVNEKDKETTKEPLHKLMLAAKNDLSDSPLLFGPMAIIYAALDHCRACTVAKWAEVSMDASRLPSSFFQQSAATANHSAGINDVSNRAKKQLPRRTSFPDRQVLAKGEPLVWSAAWPTDVRFEFYGAGHLNVTLQCVTTALSKGNELHEVSACVGPWGIACLGNVVVFCRVSPRAQLAPCKLQGVTENVSWPAGALRKKLKKT